MKLILGLGNPGSRYSKTRHNVGRRVVETFAGDLGLRWKKSRDLAACWAETEWKGKPVILAYPDSFMNECGKPAERLLTHFGIKFEENFLATVDDAALPFGRLRLRAQGTDGGHRGLRSVQEAVKSLQYARLRVGIAPLKPTSEPLEEYVLNPFTAREEKSLERVLRHAVTACQLWISEPISRAMDRANQPFPA